MATRRRCYRSFSHRRHCARPTRKFLPSTPTSSRAPLFSRDLAISLLLVLALTTKLGSAHFPQDLGSPLRAGAWARLFRRATFLMRCSSAPLRARRQPLWCSLFPSFLFPFSFFLCSCVVLYAGQAHTFPAFTFICSRLPFWPCVTLRACSVRHWLCAVCMYALASMGRYAMLFLRPPLLVALVRGSKHCAAIGCIIKPMC